MTQQLTTRATATGHFELMIDGCETPCYLKSVEGGFVKAGVVEIIEKQKLGWAVVRP